MTRFRDSLRAVAPKCGVSFTDHSKNRCSAEPFASGRGPNLSADGSPEVDDEDDCYPEREQWTMYGDLAFEHQTISLFLMSPVGYLAVELSTARGPLRNEARRAWLAHHGIELMIVDAAQLCADPAAAARDFIERVQERAFRARRERDAL